MPVRTSLGAMALTFTLVLFISGGNDIVAKAFDISLNAMTWGGRIALLVGPPIAYVLTYRICIGLQRHDREVLAHGIETGIIKRLPTGEFIEVHQPLGPVDEHGHVQLNYTGTAVPKRMNQVGRAPFAHVRGFFAPVKEKPEIQRALDALEAEQRARDRPSSPTEPAQLRGSGFVAATRRPRATDLARRPRRCDREPGQSTRRVARRPRSATVTAAYAARTRARRLPPATDANAATVGVDGADVATATPGIAGDRPARTRPLVASLTAPGDRRRECTRVRVTCGEPLGRSNWRRGGTGEPALAEGLAAAEVVLEEQAADHEQDRRSRRSRTSQSCAKARPVPATVAPSARPSGQ